MFKDRMVTEAIPERVFALCKIVEKGSISSSDLKEKMEPAYLDAKTSYFSIYRTAAEELELISVSDNMISLAVEPSIIENIGCMRKYAITKLPKYKEGQFYQVTHQYFQMNADVLSGEQNVSNLAPLMATETHLPLDAMAMRGWRFWVSFLGFCYLQDMFLIPNADVFLHDVIELAGFDKMRSYSFDKFISMIRPYAVIVLDENPTNHRLNYGVSNGLRTLHDLGVIKLEHILDQEAIWTLYPMEAHVITGTVTNITICK